MISKAFEGTQQYRGSGLSAGTQDPFATPLLSEQPTLSELTLAALARLGTDGDGLYLLSEQGGVDRAMHSNNLGRAIEGYLEFDQAIRNVISWVNRSDTAATFDDTLLIVSADHDHLLFGPNADTDPFQPVLADGPDAGLLPEHRWFSGSHSNQLVPFFAMGAGSNELIGLADQTDFFRDAQGREFGRGAYTDQAEVGRFLLSNVSVAAVPEPTTWAMMIVGMGAVGGAMRRRNRQIAHA